MPNLNLRVPLPETGGELIGFRPEYYYRSPEEIAKDVQIKEEQLRIARLDRRRAEREYARDYLWYDARQWIAGGGIGFLLGAVAMAWALT